MRPIPVLMYHHVNDYRGDMVTVTRAVFDRQMRYLRDAGYRPLRIDEMFNILEGQVVVKEKAVVITFDDGWLDNYLFAFPILKKYEINATIFIVTDWVDRASEATSPLQGSVPKHAESKKLAAGNEAREAILSWKLVEEMAGSGLVDFCSHTRSHPRCDQLFEPDLARELAGSKAAIEKRLKQPCRYLCWPKGKYNDAAIEAAKDAGYRALFTTEPAVVSTGTDPFVIGRIVVKDNVEWFKKRLLIYTTPLLSALYLRLKKK